MVAALAAASTATVAAQAPPSEPAPEATAGDGGQAPAAKVAPPQTSTASTRQAAIEAEQAAKVPNLRPYEPKGAERYFATLDKLLQGSGLAWHPFFESAYSGGGFTLGAGRSFYVSSYNTLDFRGSYTVHELQADRGRVPRAADVQPARRAVGTRRLARSDEGRLLRHRTRHARKTTGRTISSSSPTVRRSSPSFRRAGALMLRGGARVLAVDAGAWRRHVPVSRDGYTPETLPGLGAKVTYLHTQGAIGFDWRTSPGYTRRGGVLRRTMHDYNDRTTTSAFRSSNTKHCAHADPARDLGPVVPRPRPDGVRQGRSADPVLHAAVARRRLDAARLQQLALPRPEQPAAAGGVADHGQPLSRHRRSSTTPARLRRAQTDLDLKT